MDYAIDPELAPILSFLPEGTIEDVGAARAMLESLADMGAGTIDESGLDIVADDMFPPPSLDVGLVPGQSDDVDEESLG